MPSKADKTLVEYARCNPNATVDKTARDTGIPLSTVYKRIRALRARGVISSRLTVAEETRFFPHRARISINFDQEKLFSRNFRYRSQREFAAFFKDRLLHIPRFRKLTQSIAIHSVELVLGGMEDCFVIVGTQDVNALCDFVTGVVRNLPGVKSTNTATLVRMESAGNHFSKKETHPPKKE